MIRDQYMYRRRSLGPMRIPVPLPGIALTDRDDGTVWAVLNDGNERIRIVSPIPGNFSGVIYGPQQGPWLRTPHGTAQLLIRDGYLGYEIVPYDTLARPTYVGSRFAATAERDAIYLIKPPTGVMPRGGVLAYETEPF